MHCFLRNHCRIFFILITKITVKVISNGCVLYDVFGYTNLQLSEFPMTKISNGVGPFPIVVTVLYCI